MIDYPNSESISMVSTHFWEVWKPYRKRENSKCGLKVSNYSQENDFNHCQHSIAFKSLEILGEKNKKRNKNEWLSFEDLTTANASEYYIFRQGGENLMPVERRSNFIIWQGSGFIIKKFTQLEYNIL